MYQYIFVNEIFYMHIYIYTYVNVYILQGRAAEMTAMCDVLGSFLSTHIWYGYSATYILSKTPYILSKELHTHFLTLSQKRYTQTFSISHSLVFSLPHTDSCIYLSITISLAIRYIYIYIYIRILMYTRIYLCVCIYRCMIWIHMYI